MANLLTDKQALLEPLAPGDDAADAGWLRRAGDETAAPVLTSNSALVIQGFYSLLGTKSSVAGTLDLQSAANLVPTAGQQYTISADVRRPDGSGPVRMWFEWFAGAVGAGTANGASASTAFTVGATASRVHTTATAPAGTTHFRIVLRSETMGAGHRVVWDRFAWQAGTTSSYPTVAAPPTVDAQAWARMPSRTVGAYYNPAPVVTAINSASTLAAVETAMASMATAYAVTIDVPTTTLVPSTGWTAPPLEAGDLAALKVVATGVVNALSQYPTELVTAANLGTVYLVKDLLLTAGGSAAGMETGGDIWIDSDSGTNPDWVSGKVFHHEYAHILQNTTDEATRGSAMAALNHPSYPYGGAWTSTQGSTRPPGYTGGGWVSRVEDEAEIHGFYLGSNTKTSMDSYLSADPRLEAKMALWWEAVASWTVATFPAGSTVTLAADGTAGTAAGALTFAWSQTAGPTLAPSPTDVRFPTVTPVTTGSYTYSVTVTEPATGQTATDTVSFTVTAPATNLAPIATFGPNRAATPGQLVTLLLTASDIDGTIAMYDIDQTGGPAVTLTEVAANEWSFPAPAGATTLTFLGTVIDDDGATATAPVSVTVGQPTGVWTAFSAPIRTPLVNSVAVPLVRWRDVTAGDVKYVDAAALYRGDTAPALRPVVVPVTPMPVNGALTLENGDYLVTETGARIALSVGGTSDPGGETPAEPGVYAIEWSTSSNFTTAAPLDDASAVPSGAIYVRLTVVEAGPEIVRVDWYSNGEAVSVDSTAPYTAVVTVDPGDNTVSAVVHYGELAPVSVAAGFTSNGSSSAVTSTQTWAYTDSTRAGGAVLADGFTATGQALYLTPRPADEGWPGTLVAYRTWDPGVDRQVVPEWADSVPDGFVAGPATGQWWNAAYAPAGTPVQRTFRSPNGYPDFFGGNETDAFALQTAELPNGTRTQTMFQELDFLVNGVVVTHRAWVSNFTVANVTTPPPDVEGVVTLDLASFGENAMGVVVKAGSSAADRGTVLASSVGGRTTTFWRARHPGPSSSTRWGTDWRCAFDQMSEPIPPADEMWFAYDMHHQTDWNTAQNAPGDRKMPCLAGYDSTVGRIGDVDNSGSSTETHREDQWTARWMAQGRNTADIRGLGYLNVWKLGSVLHDDNRAASNSGITSFYNGLQWASGGNPVNIPKGWATVEQYVKMNTPGQSNGIIRWWLNGVLVCERTDVGYRSSDHPNLRINAWNAVMFWGGPVPAENPTEATQVFFDDFRFSTAGRITA